MKQMCVFMHHLYSAHITPPALKEASDYTSHSVDYSEWAMASNMLLYAEGLYHHFFNSSSDKNVISEVAKQLRTMTVMVW